MSSRLRPRPFPFPLHIGTDICRISRIHGALFPDTSERSRGSAYVGETAMDYVVDNQSPTSSRLPRLVDDANRSRHSPGDASNPWPANLQHFPLLRKIMTPAEQTRFSERYKRHFDHGASGVNSIPGNHRHGIARASAGIWAIKEAAVKAVKPRRLNMRDAEVFWDMQSSPYVVVVGTREGLPGQVARVSLSHDGEYAVASVLALEDPGEGDVGGEAAARAESGQWEGRGDGNGGERGSGERGSVDRARGSHDRQGDDRAKGGNRTESSNVWRPALEMPTAENAEPMTQTSEGPTISKYMMGARLVRGYKAAGPTSGREK